MSAAFVHLSDIHFGQERDSRIFVHDDVKERLIDDVRSVVAHLPSGHAAGIIVTGDIAYAGKKTEYDVAGTWLDNVAEAVGCRIYDIQMVPGNHDIDRDQMSGSMKLMLEKIADGGVSELDAFLADKRDRETIFDRFSAYGAFSEGYRCPLDTMGCFATDCRVELAEGRAIRFIRINSALLCSGAETVAKPELIFGARQYVIPRTAGEEMVILCHHPLTWFKDTPDAIKYIRSRARIFISGHEHQPNVCVEQVEPGCELLMLAAGATVPPKSNDAYTYTYNVIEFDWDRDEDALAVTIHPRAWNPEATRFEDDPKRLGGQRPKFVLASPNFRAARNNAPAVPRDEPLAKTAPEVEASVEVVPAAGSEGEEATQPMAEDNYPMVLLKFFRELTEGERLKILVQLDAISGELTEPLTQAVERRLFDHLVNKGRIEELDTMIGAVLTERAKGDAE